MIPLKGKNIKLRAVEPSDLEVLYEWENDPQNWNVSNTVTPFSKHVLQKYIDSAQIDIYEARQLRMMIDRINSSDNIQEVIGTIDLFDFDPAHRRAGLGILIARKEDRLKGLASEALSIFIEYAFSKLHLHQIYCHISSDNQASLGLFEKSGFQTIGKKKDWLLLNNQWIDVYLLQIINPQDS